MVYNRRLAVERLNGRLKARIHSMLSTIVRQAQAQETKALVSVRRIASN